VWVPESLTATARRAISALAFVVVFVGASRAVAQGKGTETSPASNEARKDFEAGSRLYDVGQYDAAIERFKRAYHITGKPGLLLSIAQAYRLKGPATCPQALSFYKQYLSVKPDGPYRNEVLGRIDEMRACAEAAGAAAAPPVPPERSAENGEKAALPGPPSASRPVPPSRAIDRSEARNTAQNHHGTGEPWKAIGWTSAAVGATGVAVGIVTGLLALHLQSELGGACAKSGACPRAEADRIQSYEALRTAALIGGIFGVVGGVAAVFSFSRGRSDDAPNRPSGQRARLYIGLRGHF
jgi:hypothetical protein